MLTRSLLLLFIAKYEKIVLLSGGNMAENMIKNKLLRKNKNKKTLMEGDVLRS